MPEGDGSGDRKQVETLLESNPRVAELGGNVLIARNVQKAYDINGGKETVVALRDLNLVDGSEFYPVKEGEFVMIRGPSGGGKTTFLNMVGTIDSPSSGEVELFGDIIGASSTENFLADLRLEKIGFVFQTFNLIATMSAFENVELPMTLLGKLTKKQRRARATMLLTQVGLQDRMNHLPCELSGGEQQRVTIARALSNEPKLLLLDEPTGDLDTRNTVEVMDLLTTINRVERTTCLMVTHNPDVECYADRILYVQDGGIHHQVLNEVPVPLVYDDYVAYLNEGQKAQF